MGWPVAWPHAPVPPAYSPPGGGGGIGGGFTDRHEVVLSEDGTFRQSREFSISIEGGEGGEVTGPDTGTWQLRAAAGQALLELHGDGEPVTHVLSPGDAGEVLLNGRRYFVTTA